MKRSAIVTTLIVAMTLLATSTFAATTVGTTNTNNVTATVVGSCKWITPLTMPFGNYDPFNASATTQTATVNFKCVKKTNATDTYKIWFSKTAGNMVNGANPDLLAYTLTDNANAALPTSSATATTVAGVAGVSGAGYSFIVKGSIAPGQDVSAYATQYQDTVVANVDY